MSCQQTLAAHALYTDFFSRIEWRLYKMKHSPVQAVAVQKLSQ